MEGGTMKNENLKFSIGCTRLDKIGLKDGEIISIDDLEELKQRNVLFVNEKGKKSDDESQNTSDKYVTRSNQAFSYLKIKKDGEINQLKAGKSGFGKQYVTLQTNVCDGNIGNLQGNTVTEYHEQIKRIEEKLQSNYGIQASFDNSTVNYIEINRTFRLEHDFNAYSRDIKLILAEMPRMNYVSEFGHTLSDDTYFCEKFNQIETHTVWNKRGKSKNKQFQMVSIYNKSKQLRGTIYLDGDCMRFEITLAGVKNIQNAFNTDKSTKPTKPIKLYELTDEKINQYFAEQIDKLIVKPLDKWRTRRNAYLKKLIKSEREKDIYNWQVNVLRVLNTQENKHDGKPCLLDVCELYPIIDKIKDIKRKQRVKDRFLVQAEKYESIFTNRDDLKLQEIIGKLLEVECATLSEDCQDKDNIVAEVETT